MGRWTLPTLSVGTCVYTVYVCTYVRMYVCLPLGATLCVCIDGQACCLFVDVAGRAEAMSSDT